MWQPILLHIDRELTDRLAGIEQIEDAMAHSDSAVLGRWVNEPVLCLHVCDRDQLGARAGRSLERREVGLPGCVVVVTHTSDFWVKRDTCDLRWQSNHPEVAPSG
jgi:hypothetical protein